MKTLREWRLSRLLSVRGLETVSGVTTKTIMDIEHGRRHPQYGTMRKLCEALGVEPGDVTEFAEALDHLGKDAA